MSAEAAALHQRELRLFSSPEMSVTDYRCRVACHPTGPEEQVDAHTIVFVRSGTFRYTMNGETIAADPNYVLFFAAGRPYRVAHPVAGGDDCTSVSLSSRLVRDLRRTCAPRAAERGEAAFPRSHALCSARALRLQYELLAVLRGSRPSPLVVQDLIAALADEAVREAYGAVGVGSPRPGAARRARDLAEAARYQVQANVVEPPSLEALSRSLGCSPFHLSRTFHRVVGVPIRRYVARMRARVAAERLLEGAQDLTGLALDLGYADHSHFTNAFRQEWGEPPSRFRASLGTRVRSRRLLAARRGLRRTPSEGVVTPW
jgi:AraC family transcriptional regulator